MPHTKKAFRILLLVAVAGVVLAAGDPGRGKALYGKSCALCHGASGRGDGMAGKGMNPKPSSFTDAAAAARTNDAYIAAVIKVGKLEALKQADKFGYSALWMPAFPDLGHDQVAKLVALVRDIQKTRPQGKALEEITGKHAEAFSIYKEKCARCHGENFDGKGPDTKPTRKEGKEVVPQPAPPDFRDAAFLARFDDKSLEKVLELGTRGAMEKSKIALMPGIGGSWNDGQRADVVAFLRSLAEKGN